MRLSDCHNVEDFRLLAKARLPWPVFDYIDGAADDELTKTRNTAAFADVDLVPDVLAGVADDRHIVTIMGRKSALPLILSPTALQRMFHWRGERAVARAAEKFGLWFGISSLATVSIEEIAALTSGPKMFQLYCPQGQGAQPLDDRALPGGEVRCDRADGRHDRLWQARTLRAQRLHLAARGSRRRPRCRYAIKPRWALDYMLREKFALPNLDTHVAEGTGEAVSIASYFNYHARPVDGLGHRREDPRGLGRHVLPQGRDERRRRPARGRRSGADAIMISNHGGRQLDGSRAPFDQLRRDRRCGRRARSRSSATAACGAARMC